jgi:hypothetical protein
MNMKFDFSEDIPTLFLDFDEDAMNEGMDALSFVDKPATDVEWRVFQKQDSYDDYPIGASTNACRAIKYKEQNPNIDCGTQIGWTRASQLCNRRRISVETIARIASFKRHLQHKDVPYDSGCGGLMVDAWGGEEMIQWSIRKLERINKELRMLPFEKQEFQDIDYEKRIVTAPVMLANTKIMRFNPDLGKYFVQFKPETIEKMMRKYFKENKIHKVNTNHDPKSKKDGVYMMESYIVGDRNTSKLFPNIPDGSWVATFYVENDEVWDQIKKGEYNGFSLEGYFIEKYEDDMVDKLIMEIESTLRDYTDETLIKKKIKKLLNIE